MHPARVALALALLAVAGGVFARPTQAAPGTPLADLPAQDFFPDTGGGALDLGAALDEWTQHVAEELQAMPQAPQTIVSANRAAFLTALAVAEGTENAGGYACLYGSRPSAPRTFSSFADHPRIASRISSTDQRWTSAAGRYQFMAVSPIPGGGFTRVNTWDRLKKKLALPDFSPASQDRAALELVAECGALADVDAGRVLEAASKVRSQWASLPGAGYGQPERSRGYFLAAYEAAGGATA